VQAVAKEHGVEGVLLKESQRANSVDRVPVHGAAGALPTIKGVSERTVIICRAPATERFSCISRYPGSLFCYV